MWVIVFILSPVCLGGSQWGFVGNRDRGGQNVPNARGGGTRPESCPSKTWTFDPQIGDFLQNLWRKGSISGAPENSKFSPLPSNFRRFDPPLSQSPSLWVKSESLSARWFQQQGKLTKKFGTAANQWPRTARYRETISAIPPYCALWGFWCLNMANWVRYPSAFSEHVPLGEHAKWRCDTPPLKRGISAILARYPMRTRQLGAIPPRRYYLERVLRDMGGGGISAWDAKQQQVKDNMHDSTRKRARDRERERERERESAIQGCAWPSLRLSLLVIKGSLLLCLTSACLLSLFLFLLHFRSPLFTSHCFAFLPIRPLYLPCFLPSPPSCSILFLRCVGLACPSGVPKGGSSDQGFVFINVVSVVFVVSSKYLNLEYLKGGCFQSFISWFPKKTNHPLPKYHRGQIITKNSLPKIHFRGY